MNVFREKGYDGASLDDLTKAMGIGRPSLYAAFGDKRSLFLNVLEHYGANEGSCGIVALGEEEHIRDAVRGFLKRLLHHNTSGARGCLVGTSSGPAIGTVEGVAEAVQGMGCATERLIADRFAAAIDAGELSADFPVRERSRLLADLMHAQAYRARLGEKRDVLESEIASKVDAVLR